jgi:hypothetical protein
MSSTTLFWVAGVAAVLSLLAIVLAIAIAATTDNREQSCGQMLAAGVLGMALAAVVMTLAVIAYISPS